MAWNKYLFVRNIVFSYKQMKNIWKQLATFAVANAFQHRLAERESWETFIAAGVWSTSPVRIVNFTKTLAPLAPGSPHRYAAALAFPPAHSFPPSLLDRYFSCPKLPPACLQGRKREKESKDALVLNSPRIGEQSKYSASPSLLPPPHAHKEHSVSSGPASYLSERTKWRCSP